MQNKDKIIIEALPERFEQLELSFNSKPLSLQERFDLFRKVVNEAFDALIVELADTIYNDMQRAVITVSEGKRDNLTFPVSVRVDDWLIYDEKQKREKAYSWAKEIILPDILKTLYKLVFIENAKVEYYDPEDRRMVIKGSIFGSEITLNQQAVMKYTGNLIYYQYPARIYIDGVFTPEAVYKEWYKKKSSKTYKGMELIYDQLLAENAFKIGQVFMTPIKMNKTAMKKGGIPVSAHRVVEIQPKHIVVEPLEVSWVTIPTTWGNNFQAFFSVGNKVTGEQEVWPIKVTPSKGTLVNRRSTEPLEAFARYRHTYPKWKGFEPSADFPFNKEMFSYSKWRLIKKEGKTQIFDIGYGFDLMTKIGKGGYGQPVISYDMGDKTYKYFAEDEFYVHSFISEGEEVYRTLEVANGADIDEYEAEKAIEYLVQMLNEKWLNELEAHAEAGESVQSFQDKFYAQLKKITKGQQTVKEKIMEMIKEIISSENEGVENKMRSVVSLLETDIEEITKAGKEEIERTAIDIFSTNRLIDTLQDINQNIKAAGDNEDPLDVLKEMIEYHQIGEEGYSNIGSTIESSLRIIDKSKGKKNRARFVRSEVSKELSNSLPEGIMLVIASRYVSSYLTKLLAKIEATFE